ncbi:hypothetical protein A0J48_004190 [Sphaerospermopsis aphanizomenoides BCCUSP55]|uniref:hypothetical protein n=1 Tax=Sphaerospermopsis aphanizomenoides TaxID=459663 RepID=UPI001906C521|nr:hypothetical protein [Sphaerospermopsis aphanizomenoides]MBK1986748.1 hypothetical protein [Sphaerospermopsis aphanizomenoides BCCUSP55]
MSSGSSGRYQSKIFNFFNQHSRRLSQKLENTVRHLQVATKWSVEALLYPLYQIFQPDEFAGKRLQAKAKPTHPQLQAETPPPADAPIQKVLELVKSLPSAANSNTQTLQNVKSGNFLGDRLQKVTQNLGSWLKKSQPSPSLPPENTLQHHIPTVQGIAAKLENRQLVLVADNNRVLDVLTIKQQAKLTDKINSEIAEYRHSLKLIAVKTEQELLPKIDHILTKLTGKDTANITDSSEKIEKLNIPSYPGKLLAWLDTAVAKLEAKALVPVQQRSQEIIQLAQTQLDIFIYGKEQVETRGEITVNADDLEKQPLNISALIEAAINYFFGGRKISKIQGNTTSQKLPGKPIENKIIQNNQLQESDLIADSGADSWLTWGDLFGGNEDTNEVVSANSFTDTKHEDIFNSKQSTKDNSQSSVEQERENQKFQPQFPPDWIETTATFLGYEKHPLEEILAWLDHVLLWVEMIFMNMIYFFKGLLQG